MRKKIVFLVVLVAIVGVSYFLFFRNKESSITADIQNFYDENIAGPIAETHPLSIESLRKGEFPGSDIVIEQKLPDGSNYYRYIASYRSDGLKIYALLTIPKGEVPEGGFPAVIFNHGYIPPAEYRTTERYIAYTDAFSRNGYVLFRSDYRGHGNSEGDRAGGYGSNAYTIDILNAVSSIKKLTNPELDDSSLIVDPEKIGMWGHSMGGHITLRNMVVNNDVKAGVIWAGVVASYPDLLENWRRRSGNELTPFPTRSNRGGWRNGFLEMYGSPAENPEFWNSISATTYLDEISGPLQLHHGTNDTSVPYEFSENLASDLNELGKEVEVYIYPSDDHNLSVNFTSAINRSVEFFDKYLK